MLKGLANEQNKAAATITTTAVQQINWRFCCSEQYKREHEISPIDCEREKNVYKHLNSATSFHVTSLQLFELYVAFSVSVFFLISFSLSLNSSAFALFSFCFMHAKFKIVCTARVNIGASESQCVCVCGCGFFVLLI